MLAQFTFSTKTNCRTSASTGNLSSLSLKSFNVFKVAQRFEEIVLRRFYLIRLAETSDRIFKWTSREHSTTLNWTSTNPALISFPLSRSRYRKIEQDLSASLMSLYIQISSKYTSDIAAEFDGNHGCRVDHCNSNFLSPIACFRLASAQLAAHQGKSSEQGKGRRAGGRPKNGVWSCKAIERTSLKRNIYTRVCAGRFSTSGNNLNGSRSAQKAGRESTRTFVSDTLTSFPSCTLLRVAVSALQRERCEIRRTGQRVTLHS